MSRTLLLSAALVIAFAPAPAARAADEPKDIIAKAIKAHGGEELLTKYKAARSKNKGKIDLPGLGEVEFTQETSYMIPGRFREAIELKVANQNISVLTLVSGDKITIELNGEEQKGAGDKVKEGLKDAAYMMEISRLVPLKDKKYALSLIGEDKVEGKKVIGVTVASKGEKDVSLYFDKETGLLAKLEYRTKDMTGKEITEERIVTEYKKNKDGVPQPKKVVVKHDGKQYIEAEMLELTMLEKIDESEFKK